MASVPAIPRNLLTSQSPAMTILTLLGIVACTKRSASITVSSHCLPMPWSSLKARTRVHSSFTSSSEVTVKESGSAHRLTKEISFYPSAQVKTDTNAYFGSFVSIPLHTRQDLS